MSAASPRRAATRLVAAAAMAALPATAFVVSPAARADDSSPGSQLAGINTSAVSTGVQVAPFTPNIVGAGNAAEGDLFQVSMPYASSNSSTGPMTQGLATPVYPGSTASGLGTALQTFAPTIPPQLVSLLNDPVLARSAFPPQLTAGPSGTYQPPGAGAIGVGTASTSSNQGGTQATATLNDTAPLGNGVAGPIVGVGSSTSSTSASVQAASISTESHTSLGTVIVAGVVTIGGISSDSSASSDGTTGKEKTILHVGAVTVLGQKAYIGPDGIHLNQSDPIGLPLLAASEVLDALQAAGVTLKTVAPIETHSGATASVTSGVVHVSFLDTHIPNPQIPVALPISLPLPSSVRLDVDLGLSTASANATALPPFASVSSNTAPAGTAAPSVTSSPQASPGTTSTDTGTVSAPALGTTPAAAPVIQAAPAPNARPARVIFGIPISAGWVVLAVLLSVVAAGPLLGYANWQLLKDRNP